MTRPAQAIPPFAALRAFHAAAARGRFRDAAKDLGISESAVSHQVRRLEDYLRVALFERLGPKVRLTPAGQRYYDEIDPALTRIGEATRTLMGPAERMRVVLTLPPSLTTLWLIPHLAAFERDHPGIDLQVVTTTRLCDLAREQIDLAIRHGQGDWSDVDASFLLTETTIPVCVPGLVDPPRSVTPQSLCAALAGRRLIVNSFYPDEWLEWAAARGIEKLSMEGVLRLESQDQVLEAAEQGLGLAMGRQPLVDRRLDRGTLIAPFGAPSLSNASYFLCQPPNITPSAAARRVARWLQELARTPAPAIKSPR